MTLITIYLKENPNVFWKISVSHSNTFKELSQSFSLIFKEDFDKLVFFKGKTPQTCIPVDHSSPISKKTSSEKIFISNCKGNQIESRTTIHVTSSTQHQIDQTKNKKLTRRNSHSHLRDFTQDSSSKRTTSSQIYKSTKDNQSKSYQPQNVQSYQPQNVQSYQPQNVQSYQPQNVQSYQPQNVQSYQPQNVQSYQPQNVQSYQPQNVQSYQPQNVQSYQPQNVQSYQPQNVHPYHTQNSPSYQPQNSQSHQQHTTPSYNSQNSQSFQNINPYQSQNTYHSQTNYGTQGFGSQLVIPEFPPPTIPDNLNLIPDMDFTVNPQVLQQIQFVYDTTRQRSLHILPTVKGACPQLQVILTSQDPVGIENGLKLLTNLSSLPTNHIPICRSTLIIQVMKNVISTESGIQTIASWCLYNLTVSEDTREVLREVGAIPFLVEALMSATPKVVDYALKSFNNLLKIDANKEAFVNSGGIYKLLSLLTPKAIDDIYLLALRTLMFLPWNERNKDMLLSAGGLPRLIFALQSIQEGIRKSGSWLICTLISTGNMDNLIRECGVMRPLIEKILDPSPFVREQVVGSIANLALNEINLEAFRIEGGIGPLVQLALTETSPQIILKLVWALCNLLVIEENQLVFQQCGGIPCLIEILKKTNDLSLRTKIANTFVNLTQFSDQIRGEIGLRGGVPPLLNLLYLEDFNVQEQALKALVNLSLNYENEDIILRENGIEPIVYFLSIPQPVLNELSAMALSNLSLNSKIRDAIRYKQGTTSVTHLLCQFPPPRVQYQSLKLIANLSINGNNRAFFNKQIQLGQTIRTCLNNPERRIRDMAERCLQNLSFPTDEFDEEESENQGPPQVNEQVQSILSDVEAIIQEEVEKERKINETLGDVKNLKQITAAKNEEMRREHQRKKKEEEEKQKKEEETKEKERKRKEEELAAMQAALEKQEESAEVDEETKTQQKQQFEQLQQEHQEEEKKQSEEKEQAYFQRRLNVVAELTVTERTYVQGLNVMIKKYMNPMLAASSSKKPIITEPQVRKIFSISELILNYHSILLEGFEKRLEKWSDSTTIGDYFIKMAEFLRCYTQYVNNYDEAIELLTELEQKPAFLQFLKDLTNSDTVKGQKLYSYLIMPIQRIPRYELLLSDLYRHTKDSHADYNNLREAGELVQQIAVEIDDKKAMANEQRKMVSLQEQIFGMPKGETLLAAHRLLLKDGVLVEHVKNKEVVYRCVLCNDLFVISKPQKSRKSTITQKFDFVAKFPLKAITNITNLSGSDDVENGFKVQTNQNTYIFSAESPIDKEDWLSEFEKAMKGAEKMHS